MKPTFQDKFLPTQPEYCEYFDGDTKELVTGLYALATNYSDIRMPNEEFSIRESDQFSIEEMGSNPILLRFLEVLIALKRPGRVLEVGTFIGVASMYMARVLPSDGIVVTIEKYDHFAVIAHENFLRNGLDGRIRLIEGDAFAELKKFDPGNPFDMVFLDGNKERYPDYFDLLDPLLVSDGLLVVDDVLFHGDVLNQHPKTAKGRGVKLFLEKARNAVNYRKILLPIGNGVMLMIKTAAHAL